MSSSPESGECEPDDRFAQLLARVRAGDEQAVGELVAQFEGIVRRRARRLLGPALRVHLDSVDVAQSVNRTLLIGLRRAAFAVSTPDELTRLALTLVRRNVARHWRKRKREAECRHPNNSAISAVTQTTAQTGATIAASDPLQLEELAGHVLDHLQGLDRQLVELRLQGYTTAEAARKLGVSAGLLRSRLSRLRKRLWEQGLSPESI
jgi:RNA polymerase sigma-70 factor (ECF subfamily)